MDELRDNLNSGEFDFGAKLRTLRRLNGLSQNLAAAMIDVSKSHLSKLENGKIQCPRAPLLRRIGYEYDCSMDTLLDFRTTNPKIQRLFDSILDSLVELSARELSQVADFVFSLRFDREEQAFIERLSPENLCRYYKLIRRQKAAMRDKDRQLALIEGLQE